VVTLSDSDTGVKAAEKTTDAKGWFDFYDVTAGSYSIQAKYALTSPSTQSWQSDLENVEVSEGHNGDK